MQSLKRKAIIIDLDGTLADVEHRLHYVQKRPPDWDAFLSNVSGDSLNFWCFELLTAMSNRGYAILLLSGRDQVCLHASISWLKNFQISYDEIYFRDTNDRRSDHEYKKHVYCEKIRSIYDVLFVVEDRRSVVNMWREELGLTTLQCDWGDF